MNTSWPRTSAKCACSPKSCPPVCVPGSHRLSYRTLFLPTWSRQNKVAGARGVADVRKTEISPPVALAVPCFPSERRVRSVWWSAKPLGKGEGALPPRRAGGFCLACPGRTTSPFPAGDELCHPCPVVIHPPLLENLQGERA